MKATIKGRIYDTNKATLIAKDNNGFCPMDERYFEIHHVITYFLMQAR